MSDRVELLDRTNGAVLLVNAMAEAGALERFGILGDPATADVQVFVNGVEVPFAACLASAVDAIYANLDAEIAEKAKVLLSGTALGQLQTAIEQAQWAIEDSLKVIQEQRR